MGGGGPSDGLRIVRPSTDGGMNVPFAAWRGCAVTPIAVLLLPELMGAVGGVLRRCNSSRRPARSPARRTGLP